MATARLCVELSETSHDDLRQNSSAVVNLQEALDEFLTREPEISFDLHDHLRLILAATRSVVEGTDTPDYKAAHQVRHEQDEPGFPEYVSTVNIVDAAVKGRRLVEWEDTE